MAKSLLGSLCTHSLIQQCSGGQGHSHSTSTSSAKDIKLHDHKAKEKDSKFSMAVSSDGTISDSSHRKPTDNEGGLMRNYRSKGNCRNKM